MWPTQAQADSFYGNPRGGNGRSSPAWEAANLSHVVPPFNMYYDGKPVASVKIHRKCADSLKRVFDSIWLASGKSQAQIDRWGVSLFGGSYNFRLMRGSNHLSMHSYGCAIDLAPERFPMGTHAHTFVPQVIKAFADEGWVNLPTDRMHFQAARVTATQPVATVKPAIIKAASQPLKSETTPMDNNMIGGIIRAIAPPIIAFLIGKGVIPAGDYAGMIASLVGMLTAVWSIHSNMPPKAPAA